MKIDFSQALKDLDGNVLTEQPGATEAKSALRPITLRVLAVNALMAVFEDERTLSGEEKVRRYDLAFLVHNSKDEPVEITVEDATLIKKLLGKLYAPLLVGQAWRMLEG